MKKGCYFVILLLAGLACFFLLKEHSDRNTINIGAILPLTGPEAKFGVKFKSGIDLAISEEPELSNKIRVYYEDDQSDPKIAISAFRKLLDIQNIQLVIGGALSSTAHAIGPIAELNKIPILSPTATAPDLSKFSYFISVQPSDHFEGQIMADYAINELGKTSISVVYVNNDWGKGLSDVFIQEYKKLGGKIIHIKYFDKNTNDFKSIISTIKPERPSYVLLLGYINELLIFLRQAGELGLKTKYLSAFSFYDKEIPDKIPDDIIEGSVVMVPIYDSESPNEIVKKFVHNYKNIYLQIPDMYVAHAYDCAKIAIGAIKKGKKDGSSILSYIKGLSSFEGVTGNMKFDSGFAIKSYKIFIIKKGKYEYQKTINPYN